MNLNDDGINEQFEILNKQSISPTPPVSPQPVYQNKHFDITDKIIDKINDDKYLVKISFREFMAYACPIIFNRDLEQSKIDELYTSIKDGYDIPFTIDAIYDPNTNIQEKNIKIINGNHRHGAICKYITEHDKLFNCDFKVYIWIYVVLDCETTNVKQSIDLYTKINNHLPFKEPIIVDINIIEFLNKLCRQKRFKGLILCKDQHDTARQPKINKKEVFNLLTTNKDILESFLLKYSENKNNLIITENILSQFVDNINEINHRLSLKGINQLYTDNQLAKNKNYYEQAVEIGFFLNLKNSKYPKDEWIKFLCDPTEI